MRLGLVELLLVSLEFLVFLVIRGFFVENATHSLHSFEDDEARNRVPNNRFFEIEQFLLRRTFVNDSQSVKDEIELVSLLKRFHQIIGDQLGLDEVSNVLQEILVGRQWQFPVVDALTEEFSQSQLQLGQVHF